MIGRPFSRAHPFRREADQRKPDGTPQIGRPRTHQPVRLAGCNKVLQRVAELPCGLPAVPIEESRVTGRERHPDPGRILGSRHHETATEPGQSFRRPGTAVVLDFAKQTRQPPLALPICFVEEDLFAREVPVDGPFSDTSARGERRGGGALETVGGEEVERCP